MLSLGQHFDQAAFEQTDGTPENLGGSQLVGLAAGCDDGGAGLGGHFARDRPGDRPVGPAPLLK